MAMMTHPASASLEDHRLAIDSVLQEHAVSATTHIAQVKNANHGCYLYDFAGIEYDLSVLCAKETDSEEAAENALQTDAMQKPLRQNTAETGTETRDTTLPTASPEARPPLPALSR